MKNKKKLLKYMNILETLKNCLKKKRNKRNMFKEKRTKLDFQKLNIFYKKS